MLTHPGQNERGALGLARTRNMLNWEVMPPPPMAPVAQELECPQLYPAHPVQPYACQLVTVGRQTYLLGTLVDPDGDAICDPIPVTFTDQGARAG